MAGFNPFSGALGRTFAEISTTGRQHGYFARAIKDLGTKLHGEIGHIDRESRSVLKDEKRKRAAELVKDAQKIVAESEKINEHCLEVSKQLVNIWALAVADLKNLQKEIVKIENANFSKPEGNKIIEQAEVALGKISGSTSNQGNVFLSIARHC